MDASEGEARLSRVAVAGVVDFEGDLLRLFLVDAQDDVVGADGGFLKVGEDLYGSGVVDEADLSAQELSVYGVLFEGGHEG